MNSVEGWNDSGTKSLTLTTAAHHLPHGIHLSVFYINSKRYNDCVTIPLEFDLSLSQLHRPIKSQLTWFRAQVSYVPPSCLLNSVLTGCRWRLWDIFFIKGGAAGLWRRWLFQSLNNHVIARRGATSYSVCCLRLVSGEFGRWGSCCCCRCRIGYCSSFSVGLCSCWYLTRIWCPDMKSLIDHWAVAGCLFVREAGVVVVVVTWLCGHRGIWVLFSCAEWTWSPGVLVEVWNVVDDDGDRGGRGGSGRLVDVGTNCRLPVVGAEERRDAAGTTEDHGSQKLDQLQMYFQ